MRVVVTGAGGFVGQHLTRALQDAGHEVVALTLADADLTQGWPELGDYDGVVHLAGLAAVGPSFDDPQRYLETHSAMVTHLGEALVARRFAGRVVVVSTGGVYGSASGLVDESTPVSFTSPYVVSKVLAEHQVSYYRQRGLDAVAARPFNHIGPGQGPGFIVPDLASRLRELAPGAALSTGNLDSARDYTDVRDVVRAYVALLEAPRLGHEVYNIASGVSRTGHEVLAAICAALGREVPEVRAERTRAVDPGAVTGLAERLRAEAGWTPAIPFEQSVRDFVHGV